MTHKHLAWPALFVFVARAVRQLVSLVLVILVFFSWRSLTGEAAFWGFLAAGVVVVATIVAAVIRYVRFTYAVTPAGITINRGLFERKVVHIPYAKIQTVQRQQWFFLRPFGLERLTIETAGKTDDEPEGELPVVPVTVGQQIDRYRRAPTNPTVATDQPTTTTARPGERQFQINRHDLRLYALTSMGIVPILLAFFWLYDKLTTIFSDEVVDDALKHLNVIQIGWQIALMVAVLVLSLLTSYLTIIQRYYRFTLTKKRSTLTMARGYFQRSRVSVDQQRIQAVHFKQTLIRQWARLVTAQVLTADQAGKSESDHNLVLLPVLRRSAMVPTVSGFIDWLPDRLPTIKRVRSAARWLFIRNCVLVWLGALLVAGGFIWWQLPKGLPIYLASWLLWLPLAVAQGNYAARQTGVALATPAVVCVQHGAWFSREQYLIPRRCVQSLEINQSVWMARRDLVHLTLEVRAGNDNKSVEARFIDSKTARQIRDWYLPQDAPEYQTA
ncbi:PH domain-containing protein [Lactiplantibacillus plajomi]|uniref:PH domain-containing protein n=1 Tax=Lactiplantibacillus plajomi TaxID=1457217 RepID=A0ABV6K0D4_9LACO|nr:PH domain-containing protein [Lactiplantibacillus plajomi]